MCNRGIVYLAIGQEYLDMAMISAKSIIDNSSENVPIIIFTNIHRYTLKINGISIINIDEREFNLDKISNPAYKVAYLKTQLPRISPFETTFYLDCDVIGVADISDVWKFHNNSISFGYAFNPVNKSHDDYECIYTCNILAKLSYPPQYNSGVFIFFKSRQTLDLFELWANEWNLFKQGENMALTRILVQSKIDVGHLPYEYNCFYPWQTKLTKIIHYIGLYKHYFPRKTLEKCHIKQ